MASTSYSLLRRLTKPTGKVDAVLDTDTYNEIDDQFALSYLVKSDDRLNLKAIYAAPFYNQNSTSPSDGMERSYQEILHLLTLLGRDDLKQVSFRGSDRFLENEQTPVISPAAEHLVSLSRDYSEENPLYVIAIGAITNVASALLLDPTLKDRIVVIWLGGHAHSWPDSREFNMYQDVAAARILFGSGSALVQLPCNGVVSEFRTTGPELEYWLRGKNTLCDYLIDHTAEAARHDYNGRAWSRVIWDVTAVAWLTGDFEEDVLVPAPMPGYDDRYSFDNHRHMMRYVYQIHRDELMDDLITKLTK